jgi:hypothetical protein
MALFFQRTDSSGFDPEYTSRRTPVLVKNNIEKLPLIRKFGQIFSASNEGCPLGNVDQPQRREF